MNLLLHLIKKSQMCLQLEWCTVSFRTIELEISLNNIEKYDVQLEEELYIKKNFMFHVFTIAL